MSYISKIQIKTGNQQENYLIEPQLYIVPSLTGTSLSDNTLSNFALETGVQIQMKLSANAPANATLKVGTTDAKPIYYNGVAIQADQLLANRTYSLVYDGQYWQIVGDIDTNTWRGIQDKLTSDSATDSLSAKQGKVLKELIDAMDATTPTANGNATAFIDSITQTDGKITSITKKNIPVVSKDMAGLAPKGAAVSTQSTSTKFLREDGNWAAPSYITNITRSGTTFTVTRNDESTFTFTQRDNNTTYSAGTGLALDGTEFNHSNSVTPKTAYVDVNTATTASANGGTIKVTDIKYDAQGHITGSQDRTITLSQVTSYLPVSYTNIDYTSTSTTAGVYPHNGIDNPVTNVTEYGGLIQFGGSSTSNDYYGAQLLVSSAAGETSPVHAYIRRMTSTPIWSSWSTLLDDKNYKSYAWARPASITTNQVLVSSGTDGSTILRAILNNTSAGALGWNNAGSTHTNNLRLIDVNTLAYWDGRYTTTDNKSNLKYYSGGAFGTMAKETAADYAKLSNAAFTGAVTVQAPTADANPATKKYVDDEISASFAANNAMVYKGIIAGAATSDDNAYGALTPAAKCGDTYKVSAAGFINGLHVEIGDMLICTTDNTPDAATSGDNIYTTIRNNWNIIQTSEGSVSTSSTSATDNAIARWDGTSGRIIQNSTTTLDDSGNISSSVSTTGSLRYKVTNSNGAVSMLTSTNRGLYDETKSNWIIYRTQDGNHTYVPYWKEKGTSTTPVYFDASGEPVAGDEYAGGTAVTLNSAPKAKSTASFYAPTDSGTAGYILISGGANTAPAWTSNARISSETLLLYRESTTSDNFPSGIVFQNRDTTVSRTQGTAYIYAYNTHTNDSNGMNMVIHSAGNIFVGGGESPANLYDTLKSSTSENLYLTADSSIYLEGSCGNTIGNRIGIAISSGHVLPVKAESTTSDVQNLGATNALWANVYATTFHGTLDGNADTATDATNATNDSDGNPINTTYLQLDGGTMTGALNTKNNTWNKIGDDVQIGDIQEIGTLGLQGLNGNTAIRFTTYNQTTKKTGGKITWDGTKFSITSTTAVDASISGNAATATTATNLAEAPSLSADGNNMKVTAGGKTSDPFTVPYATTAGSVLRATFGDENNCEHDANNIKSNGLWSISSNGPFTVTGLGAQSKDMSLYTQFWSTKWGTQIAADYRDGQLFVRSLNNGTWKNWYAIPKFTTTTGGLGSTTQPVYIDTDGELQVCTTYADAVVNYATSAGSAESVAWDNVFDHPTNLNQFTNGPGYTTNKGTVTKVSTGAGLTGGDITTTGTISINGMNTSSGSTTKWLNQQGEWTTPPNDNTHHTAYLYAGADGATKHAKVSSGTNIYLCLRENSEQRSAVQIKQGTNMTISSDANGIITFTATDTTYSNFVKSGTGAKAGLVPSPGTTAGTTKYLCEDGTWQVPPDTKYTLSAATSSALGGIQIGYSENGKNYPVELSSNKAYVNVPWTDTNNAVAHALKTTTKFYITGTESATASTGGDTFDTGIYTTTTAGQLNATTFKINEEVTLQYNTTDKSLDFVFA